MLLWLPAVIIALTFHEYAHARAADRLGDPTARYMGRMSLNPLVHMDPIGFILLLVAGFGWAKPVPFNPLNIRGDRMKGMMLISAAGPLMNLFIAFSAALVLHFALPDPRMLYSDAPLVRIMWSIVYINVYLAVFNLIPVPEPPPGAPMHYSCWTWNNYMPLCRILPAGHRVQSWEPQDPRSAYLRIRNTYL
jgi:Zn-dependent protease